MILALGIHCHYCKLPVNDKLRNEVNLIDKKSKYDIIGAKYALHGIWYAFKTEKNLKIDLFAAVAVLFAAYLLSVSKTEFLLLVIAICLVLTAELMNTRN